MVEKKASSEQPNIERRIDKETMFLKMDNALAQLVFNRPNIRNAIGVQGIRDFKSLIEIASSDINTKVLTIYGKGKAFCTGIDLNELATGKTDVHFFEQWEDTLRTIETMDKIVIAGMHGYAISGGVQIGLASDIRVASADLILRIPKEPIVTGLTHLRLPRFIGEGRAKRMLLTGMDISAQEAYSIGLVDYVIPPDQFETGLAHIAQEASEDATEATFFTKQLFAKANEQSYQYARARFLEKQRIALNSADFTNFQNQYLERRKNK